jgi:hypothetical protein
MENVRTVPCPKANIGFEGWRGIVIGSARPCPSVIRFHKRSLFFVKDLAVLERHTTASPLKTPLFSFEGFQAESILVEQFT